MFDIMFTLFGQPRQKEEKNGSFRRGRETGMASRWPGGEERGDNGPRAPLANA
jgi:hypothetical protein